MLYPQTCVFICHSTLGDDEVARNQKVTKDSCQLTQESADLTQESPQSIPIESEANIKSPIDNKLYILVNCWSYVVCGSRHKSMSLQLL